MRFSSLSSSDKTLQSHRVPEPCRAGGVQDEVFGLHPLRSSRSPTKPDAHSNDDSEGPLALWAQWQRGQAAGEGGLLPGNTATDVPPHHASVRLGQCFLAWVPGLVSRLWQSFDAADSTSSQGREAAAENSAGLAMAQASAAGKLSPQQGPPSAATPAVAGTGMQPHDGKERASWLGGWLVADLSIGSLQVTDGQ